DPDRIGLAGHSAGAAAAVGAALALQEEGFPVAGLFLLDAVPWPRTLVFAGRLRELPLGSFRAEPSSCNNDGSTLALLGAIRFAVEDVKVVGSTHCDQEDPSDWLCGAACGGASP